jgi:tight adherence protein B
MNLDASSVYLVLVFAAVFAAAQGLFGLLRSARVKRMVNQRLKVAERVGGIQELVVELRKQRGLTASGELKSGLGWLAALIVASGVPYDPRRWLMTAGLAALGGGAALLMLTKSLILAPLGVILGGIGGPIAFLKFKAAARSKALSEQLPQALDIVVRSLEAGHPVPTAVALVGREMADPIGSEFGMAADEIAYGATLEQAVERMANRCQHADVDLFAATIRLQERAGGNLTGLLKLNAHTVRERQKMRLKVNAASAEGRMSALILTASPFVAVGAILVMAPDFYGEVIHEPFIQMGLGALGVWMLIGNIVMRRMIAMKI